MRRSLLTIALFAVLVVVLGVVLAARATPADSAARGDATERTTAQKLLGRWLGEKFGAEGNGFETRRWELLFTRASGPAVIGRKRYSTNGGWSSFEPLHAVVDSAGRIWGVDADGVLNGTLRRSGILEIVYQEPGTQDGAAAVVRLRRSS